MVMHLLIMPAAAPLILFGARPILVCWRPQIICCWLGGALTVLLWHIAAVFAYLIAALVLTARLLASERTRASEGGLVDGGSVHLCA
jgi:hypothetical protein